MRGCLFGGAVGDALGAPVEFERLDGILERFGPAGVTDLEQVFGRVGAVTDDTQMTLFTAEGLVRMHLRAVSRGVGPTEHELRACRFDIFERRDAAVVQLAGLWTSRNYATGAHRETRASKRCARAERAALRNP